jgi:hypothetical protein
MATQVAADIKQAADYLTSEIKARLNSTEKHKNRFYEMGKSAGIMLIELKEMLPHGYFIPWLMEHEISRTTAHRWMTEAKDPTKAAARRQDEALRSREIRADRAEWEEYKAKCSVRGTFEAKPRAAPNTKTQVLTKSTEVQLIRLVKSLTEAQQESIINYINQLTKEESI